jgi:GNAT superfamily N-acetyltransferase
MSGSKRSFATAMGAAAGAGATRRGPGHAAALRAASPGLYRAIPATYRVELRKPGDEKESDDEEDDDEFEYDGLDSGYSVVKIALMYKDPKTKKEKQVGSLTGYYFDGAREEFLYDADHIDQGTYELALGVTDTETGAIAASLFSGVWASAKDDEDANEGPVLVIDEVYIEERHRGKRIGQALVKAALDGYDHGLALIAPGFTRRSDGGWTDEQRAAKLKAQEKYWMECGFRRLGKTDYFGRPGVDSSIWVSPIEDKAGDQLRSEEAAIISHCKAEEKRIEAAGLQKDSDAWCEHMAKFQAGLIKTYGIGGVNDGPGKAFYALMGIKF